MTSFMQPPSKVQKPLNIRNWVNPALVSAVQTGSFFNLPLTSPQTRLLLLGVIAVTSFAYVFWVYWWRLSFCGFLSLTSLLFLTLLRQLRQKFKLSKEEDSKRKLWNELCHWSSQPIPPSEQEVRRAQVLEEVKQRQQQQASQPSSSLGSLQLTTPTIHEAVRAAILMPPTTPTERQVISRRNPQRFLRSNDIYTEHDWEQFVSRKHLHQELQESVSQAAPVPLIPIQELTTFRISPVPVIATPTELVGQQQQTEYQLRCSAFQTLDKLKIRDRIDHYAENLRRWFVRVVIAPLHSEILAVDRSLQEQGAQPFLCECPLSAPFGQQQPQMFPSLTTTNLFGASQQPQPQPTKETFLQNITKDPSKSSLHSVVNRRLQVETYLAIGPELLCRRANDMNYYDINLVRQYLLTRIQSFAEDPYLSGYEFEGGKDFQASDGRYVAWKETCLPNDSMILLHLFATYLDFYVSHHGGQSFYTRHVTCREPTLLKEKLATATAGIFLAHSFVFGRPYFSVLMRAGRNAEEMSFYETLQGSQGLFQAIVIFIILLRQDFNSILGSFDFSQLPLHLTSVIR